MPSANHCYLIGNLTKDPELRYTQSGTAVADLRLAVNRRYQAKSGERREETDFFTVIAWGKTAEAVAKHLGKGSPLFVEGRLQSRSWEDRSGQKRTAIEVVAENVQFLGHRPGSQGAPAAHDEEPGPRAESDEVPF